MAEIKPFSSGGSEARVGSGPAHTKSGPRTGEVNLLANPKKGGCRNTLLVARQVRCIFAGGRALAYRTLAGARVIARSCKRLVLSVSAVSSDSPFDKMLVRCAGIRRGWPLVAGTAARLRPAGSQAISGCLARSVTEFASRSMSEPVGTIHRDSPASTLWHLRREPNALLTSTRAKPTGPCGIKMLNGARRGMARLHVLAAFRWPANRRMRGARRRGRRGLHLGL